MVECLGLRGIIVSEKVSRVRKKKGGVPRSCTRVPGYGRLVCAYDK